jgi:hypothetical protein
VDALSSFPYPEGGLADKSVVHQQDLAPDLAAPDAERLDSQPVDVSIATPDAPPDSPLTPDAPPDSPLRYDAGTIPDMSAGTEGGHACLNGCDDNNPCTLDSCDTTTGTCVSTQIAEGSSCRNACLNGGSGTCKLGVCTGNAAPDGTLCEDNDPCTQNDKCQGGLCFSGDLMQCPAIDICHEPGHCERELRGCTTPLSSDGKGCDDGKSCTVADQCISGTCVGTQFICALGASCEATTGVCKNGAGTVAFPSAILAVNLPEIRLWGTPALAQGPGAFLFSTGGLRFATDLGTGPLAPAGSDAGASVSFPDVVVVKVDPATAAPVWAVRFGDEQEQQGNRIVANQQGQVAITGMFKGSLVFGNSKITNPTAAFTEAYMAAVDASTGAGLWALRPQITASDLAIAVDPVSSDFVVCGVAGNAPALGLAPSSSTPDDGDIVVARIAATTGAVVWGRQISASGTQSCDRVAIDKSGHVYLAGLTPAPSGSPDGGAQTAIDFGSGVQIALPPQTSSSRAAWIAKLDIANGNALAATTFGTTRGAQTIQHITCDSSGNLIVAAGVQSAAQVGDTAVTIAGSTQAALVVKLSPELKPAWVRSFVGGGRTLATAIAQEPSGTLVIAGIYTRTLALDGISLGLGTDGTTSAFIARIDAGTGSVLAARGLGTPNSTQQWAYGVEVTQSGPEAGAVWLAGVFAGVLQPGPPAAPISFPTGTTGFILKLAP